MPPPVDRRQLLGASFGAAIGAALPRGPRTDTVLVDDFDRPDAVEAGDDWESLNPGYWKIEGRALRRRLANVGDRARATGFPYHWETHRRQPMPMEWDPSLPYGMIWRRDWWLAGRWGVRVSLRVRAPRPPVPEGDDPAWAMHSDGHALLGVCFGGKTLFESWHGDARADGAWLAAWRDDGRFGLWRHADAEDAVSAVQTGPRPAAGDEVTLEVRAFGSDAERPYVTATLAWGESRVSATLQATRADLEGYFGVVARGLVDFEVTRVELEPGDSRRLHAPQNELHVAWPLGDSLRSVDGAWRTRFVCLFRNPGERAEIRVADSPRPEGGWEGVPVAGTGSIVSNDFRRNTALVDVDLPRSPAEATLYYTVWKDGADVTPDPRLGTDAVGPGTGLVGDVPASGSYVGRLPRLSAPYQLCGLSCHAIHAGNAQLEDAQKFGPFWVHDQPTRGAYAHLDDYGFQVMLWEDDVWYMELLLYPPSTDDAYRIVTQTMAGPATRWQAMRHWNVINPGDHDHGMDDVKGPEQLAVRNNAGLGQDSAYLRRNFQIVSHLCRGEQDPSPTANPRRWRRWRMPLGDFSLVVLDSRLWRSSQETALWKEWGWGHEPSLYSRTDPTRSLLGEEQFAWLAETLRTDPAPLVCLTGINGLHTIWRGDRRSEEEAGHALAERDRVAADYAGWVKAGADRVLELLGARTGVVSVYGDVHVGSIVRNTEQGVYECSFGPIGRHGGRTPIDGFAPAMRDHDGRPLEAIALYHQRYGSPALDPIEGPVYWNFLEMVFDPAREDPALELRVRNLVDAPDAPPRGGGSVSTHASATGRRPRSRLPELTTLPGAELLLATLDGRPVRGLRSLADGRVPRVGLPDVEPDTPLLLRAVAGERAEARVVRSVPPV